MGEHAVVYGRPALVAALDLRLTVRISPGAAGAVRLDLPGLDHSEETGWEAILSYARAARERWDAYSREPGPERFRAVRGEDPAHVVKVALGEVAGDSQELPHPEALTPWPPLPPPPTPLTGRGGIRLERSCFSPSSPGEGGGEGAGEEGRGDEGLGRGNVLGADALPGLALRVDSQLPIGSGFGSSAATAVGVIAGYLAFRGAALDPVRIEGLALEVERRQHGLPSGVDSAAVLFGGLLWARRLPAGGLETERLAPASPLLRRLRVIDTGTPPEEPTGAVVAAVRDRRDRDSAGHDRLLDRIEGATLAFRAQLERPAEDAAVTLELIRECQACLEELGVVPDAVRSLVRRVAAEGGAAKVSGAGSLAGPGAGSLLIYHPDPERIASWPFLRSFPFHPVHLGADGLRRETDA
jgi:mevalonate kinase